MPQESGRCRAVGCVVQIPPRDWMCARHWALVPEAIRAAHDELAACRLHVPNPGQTLVCTQAAAIWAVAQQEGTDPMLSPMVHFARRLRMARGESTDGGEMAA